MTPRHYSILTLALLTACGPCMPRDFGDTSTIIGEVCPPVGDETTEVAPGSSDGGAPSTGDESSSDGTTIIDATDSSGAVDAMEGPVECTSDEDCAEGEFCDVTKAPYVCEPKASECTVYPACDSDKMCDGKSTCLDGFFAIGPDANVCAPACNTDADCAGGCGFTKCNVEGQCVMKCAAPNDCPDGLECDPARAVCAWPN